MEEEKSVIGYKLENSPDYPDIDLQIDFEYMRNMIREGIILSGVTVKNARSTGELNQVLRIKKNFYLIPISLSGKLFTKEELRQKIWK